MTPWKSKNWRSLIDWLMWNVCWSYDRCYDSLYRVSCWACGLWLHAVYNLIEPVFLRTDDLVVYNIRFSSTTTSTCCCIEIADIAKQILISALPDVFMVHQFQAIHKLHYWQWHKIMRMVLFSEIKMQTWRMNQAYLQCEPTNWSA